MARPLVPGEVAGLLIVAGGLGCSAALAALGHDTISTCTRRSRVGRLAALFFCWHFWCESRLDPLRHLDHAVRSTTRRRRAGTMPV